jgi:hypothetical protein
MKTVGRRRVESAAWDAGLDLQRTLAAVRGTRALVPRGVHRFTTFEEADEWMIRAMARTHASLRPKTSPASARR